MVPKEILAALKIVHKRLEGRFWVLAGTTALAIQGMDFVPGDIDILVHLKDVWAIDELLADYRVQAPNHSEAERYRSHYGIYQIGDVKVETMAEFQYRLSNGEWSVPNPLTATFIKEFQGMKLRLLEPTEELKEYEAMGKTEKAKKIKAFLE